ncbi:unnamed protein product [Pleuronectes platessa]|uniref:Uncharacterized protein n=1 Tax=Pleuronectes platessa TaxID=8262 RepID=A0A9N7UA99_PLEPL|nr:unnamed protein product [Pleuronectes platessa]
MKPSWLPLAELSSSPQKKKKAENPWIRWIFLQLPPQEIRNSVSGRRAETGAEGSTSGRLLFSPLLCKVKISVDKRR